MHDACFEQEEPAASFPETTFRAKDSHYCAWINQTYSDTLIVMHFLNTIQLRDHFSVLILVWKSQ